MDSFTVLKINFLVNNIFFIFVSCHVSIKFVNVKFDVEDYVFIQFNSLDLEGITYGILRPK